MKTQRVKVFLDGGFKSGCVGYGETIESVEVFEGEGAEDDPLLIPGLIDIHTHGALGGDHSNGEADQLRGMADYYAKNGVTGFLATTMTLREETLARAMRCVRGYERHNGARCHGVNMEGPFLSYEKRGAHKAELLQSPDYDMFMRLNEESGGKVRLISIAPELGGALEFIKRASGVCTVSLAHTAADYGLALRAFESGASHVTHLFNAMMPFHHRDPGLIGAAMSAGAAVELITDGMHLHPAVVRAAFSMFKGSACLISDSIITAGLSDGEYEAGGQAVTVRDGNATLSDGTIAGSAISLMDGLRRAVRFGIPLEQAITAATAAPARAIGLEGKAGVIKPGAYADFVLLDRELNITEVIIGGITSAAPRSSRSPAQ